jgi:glycosyltransferase involved in cell wall biosynthesis
VRFGIDATGWLNRRGFGRFTRNAVRRLAELDREAVYVLIADAHTAQSGALPEDLEVLVISTRRPPADAAAEGSSRTLSDLVRVVRDVRGGRFDAFLFPSLHTWFPVPGTPLVVGVHDTIADDLPTLAFPARIDRVRWRLKQSLAIRSAERLFTVSEPSRAAIAARFLKPALSIAVVPEAPDPVFFPRLPNEVAESRAQIGIPGEYVLYVGGISPHKNVVGLVDAYTRVVEALPDPPSLVIAGALESEVFASAAGEVRDRIARTGQNGHVVLPGFVPDETLARLFSGAALVVSPSLGEGFGLPAVEAAACGAPLLLSELPAYRDSVGDAALYVPPGDTDALGSALVSVLGDKALRQDLAERARARVTAMSWDAAAAALSSLLRGAASAR